MKKKAFDQYTNSPRQDLWKCIKKTVWRICILMLGHKGLVSGWREAL